MGISNLSRLCAAVLFATSLAPALAADPPVTRGNVSVNLNPTTGYYSTSNTTLRLPDGVRATTSAGLPVVTKYPAGLQQTIPTGITIDAIKKTAPLSAVVRSTTQSVKGAATRCLTSAKCNVALLVAGEGLSRLFDGLDWVMGEGGKIQKNDYISDPAGQAGSFAIRESTADIIANNLSCPAYIDPFSCPVGCQINVTYPRYPHQDSAYTADRCSNYGDYWEISGSNSMFNRIVMGRYNKSSVSGSIDVPSSEIASGVESNYTPEPSDWPALTPELELDDVEITSAPTLQGEPKTTTVYDADGNPHKITETNIWYNFDIRDNPSPQPKLDLKKREETKTYEEGVLTGTTITNSTDSAGSGDTPPPPPESPIDCDFMPTVCAFIDWFKDDDLGEDPDLKSIMKDDEEFARSKTISFGAAVCPAPHTINLPSLGISVDLSFEFFCQFAEYARALVLAAAYIFAAYISLGVARG